MRSSSPARRVRRRPSPLLLLRRRPRLWWAVTLALALAAGALTAGAVERAVAARAAWGTTTTVLVAVRGVAAGEPIGAGDVERQARPAAMVPPTALRELPDRAVAGAAVVEGEVLVRERLAGAGLRGPAARLPSGTRAVAIPAEPGLTPPVEVGDHVDVIVALAAAAAGDGPPGFTLVPRAVVVAVDEHAVTVGVPADDAARVVVALGAGAVTLALVGAG